MRSLKRTAAVLLAGLCTLSAPVTAMAGTAMTGTTKKAASAETAGALQYDFSLRVYGPGVDNLSAGDRYSMYQWALKNDGELQYLELKNIFRDSNPPMASRIDFANAIGIPAPVPGPGAYELETTDAAVGVDINIKPAWDQYDSSTDQRRQVVVAVIDTGIDINHPELKNAIWVNEDEIPGDGIDNDGNGYVDDINGWNFFSNNNQVYTGSEDDHGTHAAGTIGAARGSMGIAGITDNQYVKIMSVKALGSEYGVGEETAVINAIKYAEANGASICNLSFGTSQYYPELEKVMRESGMLFVIAAGNGDKKGTGIDIDATPDYPSSFGLENSISVANLMFDGNLAESSNYGLKNVDIAAPGVYIVSTTTDRSYGFMTGTSMSAPMVTGVAAMLYSYRTDLDLAGVKHAIISSARQMDGLNGKLVSGGMLDAYAAMNYGR